MKLLSLVILATVAFVDVAYSAECRIPTALELRKLSDEDLMASIEGANDIINDAELHQEPTDCAVSQRDAYSAELTKRFAANRR